MKVVVVGGGWAGCSAAYFAAKSGADVILVERTDLLLGTGLVGGIMKNNGRLTSALEAKALGIGDIFDVVEKVTRHTNLNFPGHKHASLYDVERIEPAIRRVLVDAGVKIKYRTLINGVSSGANGVNAVTFESPDDNSPKGHNTKGPRGIIEGDVFIDTTGTAGPMKNCVKFGMGCAMCVLRCPSFGPRISLTGLAGIKEKRAGEGTHNFEAMSGSCKLDKRSLKKSLVQKLESEGVLKIPLPPEFHKKESLRKKACQQYAMEEFAENLIILDTGQAKLMTPYFPIESLRQIDGFKEAKYADPYSGGQGNSVRFMAMAPCDIHLKVEGIDNLFCAGEKTGPIVGHTEAIITGALAGVNAVRTVRGLKLLDLPAETAAGDIIFFMLDQIKTEEGLKRKYTFSGSVYFDRMKEKEFYLTEYDLIEKKIKSLGLAGMFS